VLLACDADLYETGRAPNETAAWMAELYEQFGPTFVERLRGGFSVVLWDRRERKLLAAVDGFGISRLVYFQDAKMLLVASRLDAIVQSAEIASEVNPRAIANFMNFGVNLAPETIF